MAKFVSVITGTASGKAGSAVFRRLQGQDIFQQYQPEVKNPRTEAQTSRRTIFTGANGMVRQARNHLRKFVKATRVGWTYRTQAAKEFILNSSESGGVFTLNTPENVTFGNGSYQSPASYNIDNTTPGQIIVDFTLPTSGIANDDTVGFVAVLSKPDLIQTIENDVEAVDLTSTLEYPNTISGVRAYIYCTVKSADGREVSTTAYVGDVTLA